MKRHLFLSLLAMASLSIAAQDSVTLSLDACLAIAQQHSRILHGGQLSVSEAQARQGSAWTFDKTDITLSQDPTSGGSTDNSLTVGQRFEFPTVYAARHRELKAETELADRQYTALQRDFEARVSSLYCDLACSHQMLAVYHRQDSVYEVFVRMAETRLANGETSRLEVFNAHQAHDEIHLFIDEAEVQYKASQRRLSDLLGIDALIVPDSADIRLADGVSPLTSSGVKVLEQQAEVNRRQYSVARHELAPDITLSARSQLLIKGFNPYDEERLRYPEGNFMGFEVGLSVPILFGGQRSKLRTARLAAQHAASDLEQAKAEAETDYREALDAYALAQQRLDYYTQVCHAEAEEMARISQVSYEQGEIGYVEYIQNQRAALELHLGHLRAINAWQQAIIRLNQMR